MTKTDEFVAKIEQLDPHLQVQKFDDVDDDYEKVEMIVWYVLYDDEIPVAKIPVATLKYFNDLPVIETEHARFDKTDFVLYSKVIKLCADYFPFLFEKKA